MIKKGNNVKILTGKDKNKNGEVIEIDRENNRGKVKGINIVKKHFNSIAKGKIIRYELDNIYALNFILGDSLGGGGSETLMNDAQGKTHGQAILLLKIDVPNHLLK